MHRLGYAAAITLALLPACPSGATITGKVTTEALELTLERAAQRSGRSIEGTAAQRAALEQLERLSAKHGDEVLKVVEDSGIELLDAVSKYGDDVVSLASKATPQARRVLALNPAELVPLSRRVGVEALELEAKVPGQSVNAFRLFGDDGGKFIASKVETEDLPRLLKYGEMADSDATRRALLEAYEKEGKSLFERIPPKLVLATGLTAAMLYGVHEASDIARDNPGVLSGIVNHATTVAGAVGLVVILLLLWRFGLMPWQRKAGPTSKPSSK